MRFYMGIKFQPTSSLKANVKFTPSKAMYMYTPRGLLKLL